MIGIFASLDDINAKKGPPVNFFGDKPNLAVNFTS